jgi:hypothetical protein
MFIRKHNKLVTALLFLVLYIGIGSFVSYTLNQKTTPFKESSEKREPVNKTKPAKVQLIIDNGLVQTSHVTTLLNTDSLGDLVEHLRGEGMVTYEIGYFVDGTRLTEVNGSTETEVKSWVFYDEGVGIDTPFTDYKLDDNNVYTLVLE